MIAICLTRQKATPDSKRLRQRMSGVLDYVVIREIPDTELSALCVSLQQKLITGKVLIKSSS